MNLDLTVTLSLIAALASGWGLAAWKGRHRRTRQAVELKRAQDEFRLLSSTLEQITDSAFEGVYWVDPWRMRYVAANPTGLKALQVNHDELLELPLEQVHPQEINQLREHFRKCLDSGESVRFNIQASRKDGLVFPVELICMPVERNGERVILALGRDLSRWQKSRRKIQKLNQLYAVLSQCNRVISQQADPQDILSQVCEIAVSEGGFDTAWAGRVGGGKLSLISHAGEVYEQLNQVKIRLDGGEFSQGPMAQSVLTGEVRINNEMESDPLLSPWMQTIREAGLRSAATIPVSIRGRVEYALAFYSHTRHYIDTEMVTLFQDLANDLSHGLSQWAAEQERQEAVHLLNQLSRAVDQSADAVMILNMDGLIDYVNPRFSEVTGYLSAEVVGRPPAMLTSGEEESGKYEAILEDLIEGRSWKGDFRKKRKNGELYWSQETISPVRDEAGNISHYICTAEDCTELRKAQDMVERLAFYDALTGLPNRRLLHDRMRQALEVARRQSHQVAVFFLDLDKFKQINDSLGHPAGDQLLREISQRLSNCVQASDTVARLGGDEFTVLLTEVRQLTEVVTVAERILEQIQRPVDLEGFPMQVTTSIGVTLYPDDGHDINDLLRNADLAMYHSKSLGRNNFQFYTEEINRKALGQVDLEARLRRAIESESFLLHYQPQISTATGKMVGVEALVRWSTPDRGVIPPGDFIPLAEETGLIEPIGEWVLQRALQETTRFAALVGHPVKLAVNLSAYQFRRPDRLMQTIRQLLENSGVDPRWLELELTESMLVDDIDSTISTLQSLRELGISLAIDDFGTGYSSLSYLKQFPIDVLKIDRTFIHDLETNPNDASITSAIIAMGQQLGLQVTAEGVENRKQLSYLRRAGCHSYQGYLCSPPVPLEGLLSLIREKRLAVEP